jgi:hypothetical protein
MATVAASPHERHESANVEAVTELGIQGEILAEIEK